MRQFAVFFWLVLISLPARGQFTTVTGTVVDAHNVPYALGTITPSLIIPSGAGSPTLNGNTYSPPTQAVGLDKNGFFSFNVADNTILQPAGTKWNFTVCSAVGTVQPALGTGPQCFSLAAPITISGTTQSLSTNLNAVALALTIPIGTGGGSILPGTANSQFSTWVPSAAQWQPQNKAIYDTRDWLICDGLTDTSVAMAILLAAIGSQEATIHVIGTSTPTASCLIQTITFGKNVTLDFSGGGSFALVNTLTPPGGAALDSTPVGSFNSATTSCSVTLNVGTSGDVIFLGETNKFATGGGVGFPTDTKGNIYQLISTSNGDSNHFQSNTLGWIASNVPSGSVTITIPYLAATNNMCGAAAFKGLGLSVGADGAGAVCGNFCDVVSPMTTFTSATYTAGSLLIGFGGQGTNTETCTAGAGFTLALSVGTGMGFCMEYQLNAAGGAVTATAPINNPPTTNYWMFNSVGLKPVYPSVFVQGGIIDPDLHQIFYNAASGQGMADFTGNFVLHTVYPEWWGASPRATAAVNTPAIQAAVHGAFGTNRTSASGLNQYNKELHFSSGTYNVNSELQWYHIIGFHITGEGKLATTINQSGTNKRIIDGQSVAYGVFENLTFSTTVSQTVPLLDIDFSGAQGIDLSPQNITFRDVSFTGNALGQIGVLISKSGGGAQGDNIRCEFCYFNGFTEAGWQIGGNNTGINAGRFYAQNAIREQIIGGDIQSCPHYGVASYGGNIDVLGTTMENGFSTTTNVQPPQTGFDVYCEGIVAGDRCRIKGVRSESLRLAAGSNLRIEDSYTQDQSFFPIPGNSPPVGAVIQGSAVGGDGRYYKVTVSGAAGGFATPAVPANASSGTATTIVDTNQTIVGANTVKTFIAGETVTQAVTGSTGTVVVIPISLASITGSLTSGFFQVGETITQSVTGVTAVIQNSPTDSQAISANNFSGTANNSNIWTGNTSGATFTPTAAPVFAPASPSLVITTATGAPDSTHNWTGGTSAAVYVPTSAPTSVNWTANAFTNFLVSIIAGSGKFQYCLITSNTANTVTCTAGWKNHFATVGILPTNPDNTSTFVIEPNWSTQFSSGGLTWASMGLNGIEGSAGGIAVVDMDNVFVPGLPMLVQGNFENVRVTPINWLAVSNPVDTDQATSNYDGIRVVTANNVNAGFRFWAFNRNAYPTIPFTDWTQNQVGPKAIVWSVGQTGGGLAAFDTWIGGRHDPGSAASYSRGVLEFGGVLGRATPSGLKDANGSDTDIQGGLQTGAGTGGDVVIWAPSAPGASGTTIADGSRIWRFKAGTGHFFAVTDNAIDIGATGANRPRNGFFGTLVSSKRFDVNQATTLVTGDFTLGAGWGATAATAITVATSKDQASVTTITTGGAGIAVNPTYQLTFHDGTWTQVPVCTAIQTGGNDIIANLTVTARSATVYTFQWNGTPTTGKTYEISIQCSGT